MPEAKDHWTSLARMVAGRLEGLDRSSRVIGLREQAEALGLEPHTLRRYLVLLAFLDRIGVSEDDAGHLPVGPLEVVLRIWNRDPTIAARALRAVRVGGLSFRKALALETRLKSVQPETIEATEPSWDQSAWVRDRVAQALGLRPDDLEELSQLDDPRFDLVQSQRTYKVGARIIAFLDEAAFVERGQVHTARLVRDALIAAALYDVVVVAFAFTRSRDEFFDYLKLSMPGRSDGIRVLTADRDPFGFEGTENQ